MKVRADGMNMNFFNGIFDARGADSIVTLQSDSHIVSIFLRHKFHTFPLIHLQKFFFCGEEIDNPLLSLEFSD